jgi:hypothetical protein
MAGQIEGRTGKELNMLSGLFVQVAHAADDIRLSTFPKGMLGTWAETANNAPPKTNLTS